MLNVQGIYVTSATANLASLLKSCSQRPDVPDKRERISTGVNSDSFIAHNKTMMDYSSGATDHNNLNPWIILISGVSCLCERTILLLFLNDSVRWIQFAPIRLGDVLQPLKVTDKKILLKRPSEQDWGRNKWQIFPANKQVLDVLT